MEQYSQELKVVLEHVIAAKAVAYAEAIDQKFETYTKQVVANARALSQSNDRQRF